MSELTTRLQLLLPPGVDFDGAIVILLRIFPLLTRQEVKVSLLRCVAARDEEIAAALGIEPTTVGDHARQAKFKLGFTSCRLVGPLLLATIYQWGAPGRFAESPAPRKVG